MKTRFIGSDNAEDLNQFIGTENYYKLGNLVYTDGVNYLCETRKCQWLLVDIMLFSSNVIQLKDKDFLTCELVVENKSGELIFADGNGEVLFSNDIEFTDFKDDGVCLYLHEGVLMLPSEY